MKIFSKIVLVLYFLFLSWLILFKLSPNLSAFVASANGRSLNLIPFAKSGGTMEVALNVIAFIPYGGLSAAASRKWRFDQQLLLIVLTSVCYELLQYIFAIGATDITDVITNVFGGLLGIGGFLLLKKIFSEKAASSLVIIVSLIAIVLAILISQTGLLGLRIRF